MIVKHNSCGLEYIYSGIFGTVPGERYRYWPVPGARNCDHLKQVNAKYNCNRALKHKNVKTGLATHLILYHTIKQQSVIFTKIF